MVEIERKYLICLSEDNWHEGYVRWCEFVDAKDEREALLNELERYYSTVKKIPEGVGYDCIENLRVYEYYLVKDPNLGTLHVVRPVLGLEARICDSTIRKMSEEEFRALVEGKMVSYKRTEIKEDPQKIISLLKKVIK